MATPDQLVGSFIGKGTLRAIYSVAKAVFISLDVLLAVGFVIIAQRSWKYRPKLHPRYMPGHTIPTLRNTIVREQWNAIVKKTVFEIPESAKVGIIDADALLNNFLKQAGVEGEHMADRLDQLSPEFKTLGRIRRAHRVRNQLVHTPHYQISSDDAREAMKDYEAFLIELGVL